MNCELCKQELEAYLKGRLPEGIKAQVKAHIESCRECFEIYQLEVLANKVMNEEKGLQPNPFIASRVMASLEAMENKQNIPVYRRVLKPVFIAVSVAAAVLIGIMAGNIYKPASQQDQRPYELTYVDDAMLESVDLLAND